VAEILVEEENLVGVDSPAGIPVVEEGRCHNAEEMLQMVEEVLLQMAEEVLLRIEEGKMAAVGGMRLAEAFQIDLDRRLVDTHLDNPVVGENPEEESPAEVDKGIDLGLAGTNLI
jgi:hypothetical protein